MNHHARTHTHTTQRLREAGRKKSQDKHKKFKRRFKPVQDVGEERERGTENEQEKDKVTNVRYIKVVPKTEVLTGPCASCVP